MLQFIYQPFSCNQIDIVMYKKSLLKLQDYNSYVTHQPL